MDVKDHLKACQLPEALAALQEQLRQAPENASLRISLFELQSVLGNWEKALAQLQILSDLDADSDNFLLAQGFRPAIQCELLREEVFSGKHTPLIFGEPDPWVSWMVQANHLAAAGEFHASQELREKALEAAPASAGKINGEPFEWIADADSRLGPLLEVLLGGKYYWVPFSRISTIKIEPAKNLRDIIWIGAQFTWSNGGDAAGLIPVRYVGTETSSDPALRMARKTEWAQPAEGLFTGMGQRMLATDKTEYPLLETREIEIEQAEESLMAPPGSLKE